MCIDHAAYIIIDPSQCDALTVSLTDAVVMLGVPAEPIYVDDVLAARANGTRLGKGSSPRCASGRLRTLDRQWARRSRRLAWR
jgi:hypothetical protein